MRKSLNIRATNVHWVIVTDDQDNQTYRVQDLSLKIIQRRNLASFRATTRKNFAVLIFRLSSQTIEVLMIFRRMSIEIIDSLTFEIARVMQAVFDELEYRLAKRALNVESKRKIKLTSL